MLPINMLGISAGLYVTVSPLLEPHAHLFQKQKLKDLPEEETTLKKKETRPEHKRECERLIINGEKPSSPTKKAKAVLVSYEKPSSPTTKPKSVLTRCAWFCRVVVSLILLLLWIMQLWNFGIQIAFSFYMAQTPILPENTIPMYVNHSKAVDDYLSQHPDSKAYNCYEGGSRVDWDLYYGLSGLVNEMLDVNGLQDNVGGIMDDEIGLVNRGNEGRIVHLRGTRILLANRRIAQGTNSHMIVVWPDKRIVKLKYAKARDTEKNWVPFVYEDELYFSYSLAGKHTVIQCDPDTGECSDFASTPMPEIESNRKTLNSPLRGTTIYAQHNNTDYMVGIAHTKYSYGSNIVQKTLSFSQFLITGAVYTNYAYCVESKPPFRVRSISAPFRLPCTLSTCHIQFPMGIYAKDKRRYRVLYGIQNQECLEVDFPSLEDFGLSELDCSPQSREIS